MKILFRPSQYAYVCEREAKGTVLKTVEQIKNAHNTLNRLWKLPVDDKTSFMSIVNEEFHCYKAFAAPLRAPIFGYIKNVSDHSNKFPGGLLESMLLKEE